jgi:hypothetical protein
MSFNAASTVAALMLTLGQAGTQPFVGTWTMNFEGQTFARLELQTTAGATSGRISLGAMHVTDQGEIDHVIKPAIDFTPLFDVSYRDGVLVFARKDGDDTDRFELRVNGDTAELTFLVTDEFRQELKDNGLPVPKPITLTRTKP